MTWVMIDMSNGSAAEIRRAGKLYLWTYGSKREALEHKRGNKRSGRAELLGPFKMERVRNGRAQYMVLERK